MVSNVDRIYVTRRSRSRTPSRVATPQVKKVDKSKPAKKKAPTRVSTRARSKTPTRTITASTPKPKASASKKHPTAKSSEKVPRKRKSLVLKSADDSDDDVDYPAKKPNTPKSATKHVGRPKKSPTNLSGSAEKVDGKVRRSRRLRDQNLNSILEQSTSKKESRASRDLSINGGVNTSQNETLANDEQGRKWGWFSCAIM